MIPVVDADLKFGGAALPGNWSPPEAGFSWSVNDVSEVRLRGTADAGPRLLLLQGHPFTHAPHLAAQRLTVELNGHTLTSQTLPDLFALALTVPPGLLRAGHATLRFTHPDHASPSAFGFADSRSLAFRFHRATLFRFEQGAAPSPLPQPAGADAELAALARNPEIPPPARTLAEQCRAAARTELSPADRDLHDLFSAAMRLGLSRAGTVLLRGVTAHPSVVAEFDDTAGGTGRTVRLTKQPGGICRLGFSSKIRNANLRVTGLPHLVAYRTLQAAPLFVRYARGLRACGSCLLNVGDETCEPGVAFCDVPSMTSFLVPDSFFVASHGYAAQRAVPPLAWNARRAAALWRGGTSGIGSGDLTTLPRWRLCELARTTDLLDAGFTDAAILPGWDGARIRAEGLAAAFVPPARFQEWKYQIDIDGTTNSWPGLFLKLLTGSTVLKVGSPGGHRQWYYHRLDPWRHYVPVQSDLSDLLEKISMLRADDGLARRIGEAGRDLALAMTYESELGFAEQHIEAAMCAALRG